MLVNICIALLDHPDSKIPKFLKVVRSIVDIAPLETKPLDVLKGNAYIDEQTAEEIAQQKGTPTSPGTASPYRDRPIEESLALFEKMNTPEVVEGSMVLRAKLDMANPNMHFRDPIMYRIIHTPHHRTGTKWHAYPMYDFAHGQSDYFEGVTHSICCSVHLLQEVDKLIIKWTVRNEFRSEERR